jgi:uncharacterized cupredoxin-like copper-binding protein
MKWSELVPHTHHDAADPEAILRDRRAAGAIDDVEFRRRLEVLRAQGNLPRRRGLILVIALGGLAVATAAAGIVYAAQNSLGHSPQGLGTTSCSAPSLPGQVVDVTLTDMNMMRGGMMAGYSMFSVTVSPTQVHAGTVSLRVANIGVLTHELVALPLGNHGVGERSVGSDGRVSESGSLGEASATCAAGAGDGIASGAAGWVTLKLAAGRYELICNIPGHYAAGMHAELDASA